MNAHLSISSNDPNICGNWSDICGNWNAADVEAEMIDLEIPLESNRSWLEYVLEHNFEDCSIDVEALAKLLDASDSITIDMKYGGKKIHIEYAVC